MNRNATTPPARKKVRITPRGVPVTSFTISSPRPHKGFTEIGVGVAFQGLRQVTKRPWLPRFIRSRLALPADLLHRAVKLNRVTVGIAHRGGVFDAGVKVRWDRFRYVEAVVAEKFDGIFKLAVVGELDAEGGAFRMRAQPKRVAELQRQKRDGIMLGSAAQEQTALAAPAHFFGRN